MKHNTKISKANSAYNRRTLRERADDTYFRDIERAQERYQNALDDAQIKYAKTCARGTVNAAKN